MKIRNYKQIPPDPASEADAEGVTVRWVISERDGADNFCMRVITVGPSGHTPYHKHPWEHEVFILNGTGKLVMRAVEAPCTSGDVIFIAAGEVHQFQNPSDEVLEFICLIPNQS